MFSDCHRGDGSFADDFANNRNIYMHALNQYYKNDFQYIELGDGDELWENLFFKDIIERKFKLTPTVLSFLRKEELHKVNCTK